MTDQSAALTPADIVASVYEYSRPERNPIASIVVGIIAMLAFYGLIVGALPTFWICLTLFAVVNLWVVWGQTTHGLRLDDQTMTVSSARDPVVISLYSIKSVQYETSGARGHVAVMCHGGRVHKIKDVHFPRPQTLAALLKPHKIDVSWS